MIPVIKDKKNIGIIVAMMIALIAVLPMSTELLRGVFQTYAILITFILTFAPIAGVLYLSHKIFKDHSRLHYGIKAALFYLLAVIIKNVVTAAQMSYDFMRTAETGDGIAGLALGICMLLFLWNVIRAIIGGPNEFPHSAATGSGGLFDRLGNLFGGGNEPEPTPTPEITGDPTAAINSINDRVNNFKRDFRSGNFIPTSNVVLKQRVYQNTGSPSFNLTAFNNAHQLRNQQYANLTGQIVAINGIINGMVQQLTDNNPTMNPTQERRLANVLSLWQRLQIDFNAFTLMYVNNFANAAGTITI